MHRARRLTSPGPAQLPREVALEMMWGTYLLLKIFMMTHREGSDEPRLFEKKRRLKAKLLGCQKSKILRFPDPMRHLCIT
jgi:hypothetical protein